MKVLCFIHFSSLMQHKSLHLSLPGCVGLSQVTTQESSEPSEAWAWSSGTCSFQPCSAISTLLWQNECPGWHPLQGAQGLCDWHRAPPWARSQCSRLQGTPAGFHGKCLSLSIFSLLGLWVWCWASRGPLFLDFIRQPLLFWYILRSVKTTQEEKIFYEEVWRLGHGTI